ncbi:hypothetical protein GCM10028895_55500 [Pontibacter rugosus]
MDTDALDEAVDRCVQKLTGGVWTDIFSFRPTFEVWLGGRMGSWLRAFCSGRTSSPIGLGGVDEEAIALGKPGQELGRQCGSDSGRTSAHSRSVARVLLGVGRVAEADEEAYGRNRTATSGRRVGEQGVQPRLHRPDVGVPIVERGGVDEDAEQMTYVGSWGSVSRSAWVIGSPLAASRPSSWIHSVPFRRR